MNKNMDCLRVFFLLWENMEPPVSYKPWDLDNPFPDPTLSDRNKQLLHVYDTVQRESSFYDPYVAGIREQGM